MRPFITLLLIALPAIVSAQRPEPPCSGPGQDDMGLWAEASLSSRINSQWSTAIEIDYRMNDNMSTVNRLSSGLSLAYKPLNWLKFGVGYNWIASRTATKAKNHYKDDIVDDDHWNGYNVTDAYWSMRHRFRFEASMESPKLWRCIRVSLRERYQFTWRNSVDADRTKYRYKRHDFDDNFEPLDEPYYTLKDDPVCDINHKECESSHLLRSRLKVAWDKKRCRWSPFVSYEWHNDLTDGMNLVKSRLCVGTEYKINKRNEIGIAYLFNTEHDDVDERMHVINISYGLKF